MKLHPVDISIIIGYIVLTVIVGFWISKKASKNLQAYFLGGNKIPYYILGLSNASGMFDITGTMWTVSICFLYGLKSFWIPWVWPVWNQVFLMIFLAVWLRRSNVMTGAEWIKTRFGDGVGANLSHIIVVIFAVVSVIGMNAYAFESTGKFFTSFFPWDLTLTLGSFAISSENMYAIIIMGITTLYVIKGGMYSVVFTEILQFALMTIACIVIGIIAMQKVGADQIQSLVPSGWFNFTPEWKLNLDWSGIFDPANQRIESDGFKFFGFALTMMVVKGILVSTAGPVPSYDMQRVLATRTAREAAKMTGVTTIVLWLPRTLMVAGFTVLAVAFFDADAIKVVDPVTSQISYDFEKLLPWAMDKFLPVGLFGLLMAGLIAAFMSTFSAGVNAAPAYLVNDIYKKYINSNASPKKYVKMSYWASFLVVILGIFIGFFIDSINSITMWIVSSLFGGYTAANLLKWIWWRFNGFGYFWGMFIGLVASLFVPKIFPDLSALNSFPIIFLVSIAGCIFGSLLTEPDDEEVLKKFYYDVRPWGFWKPIYKKVKAERPEISANNEFLRDMLNCAVGIAWQMSLVVMAMYIVLRDFGGLAVTITIFVATSLVLKFNWFDKLKNHPDDKPGKPVLQNE